MKLVVAAGLVVLIAPAAVAGPAAESFGSGPPISLVAFGGHRHQRTDDARPARSSFREPAAKPETAEQHRQYLKHYGF